MLAKKLNDDENKYSGGWNFGPIEKDAKTVKWITEFMIQNSNTSVNWKLDKEINPHEAGYLKLDISKAKTNLGWKPIWQIEKSLLKVLDWHIIGLTKVIFKKFVKIKF